MELPSSEFSTILAALNGDAPTTGRLAAENEASGKGEDIPEPNLDEEMPEEELGGEIKQPPEDEDLLNFEDPNAEEETTEELGNDEVLDDVMAEDELPAEGELPSEEELAEEELLPKDELAPEDEAIETEEEETPEEDEEDTIPEPELPLDEAAYGDSHDEEKGIPKVNMLANLISWVARAKQEIGYEQLPSFLEVYGISGHLSPELKDVIIRLAEISKDLPDNAADSVIWSQTMLSLHGILTGGDAPLNPVMPAWVDASNEAESSLEDEIIEIDKTKDKVAKLKLVLPDSNGKSKEFCINLTPEDNGNGTK
jgi:hypothetical protein